MDRRVRAAERLPPRLPRVRWPGRPAGYLPTTSLTFVPLATRLCGLALWEITRPRSFRGARVLFVVPTLQPALSSASFAAGSVSCRSFGTRHRLVVALGRLGGATHRSPSRDRPGGHGATHPSPASGD